MRRRRQSILISVACDRSFGFVRSNGRVRGLSLRSCKMGDEFFAGKAGPAVTSAAAAAAANAAANAVASMASPNLNLSHLGDFSDVHSPMNPMKVLVPDSKRKGGKGGKGGGRGGKTPQRKAATAVPAPPEFDPALAALGQYPPPYSMAPSPYPAPGSVAPCPMSCPMPMYHMMPFMYPPMYPGMPSAQPPPLQPTGPADKGRGKQAQGKGQKDQKDSSKKRRGKAKGKETSPAPQMEVDTNCSPELLTVRNAQGNAMKAKVTLQEALPHLLEFAQDQHGSRFLQNKLDEASPEESILSDIDTTTGLEFRVQGLGFDVEGVEVTGILPKDRRSSPEYVLTMPILMLRRWPKM